MTDAEYLTACALRVGLFTADDKDVKRFLSIAARYARMEKALREIRDKHQPGNTWCVDMAREALEEKT